MTHTLVIQIAPSLLQSIAFNVLVCLSGFTMNPLQPDPNYFSFSVQINSFRCKSLDFFCFRFSIPWRKDTREVCALHIRKPYVNSPLTLNVYIIHPFQNEYFCPLIAANHTFCRTLRDPLWKHFSNTPDATHSLAVSPCFIPSQMRHSSFSPSFMTWFFVSISTSSQHLLWSSALLLSHP